MIKMFHVNEIVNSISETHSFNSDRLYAINTSDVVNGEMQHPLLLPVKELKGQFKKTVKNGDILFSEIRPANRHFAVVNVDNPDQYVASTKLMVLRKFNNAVDAEYFYYWLTNTPFLNVLQRRAENRICSFPQITFELLSEYVVPVPDIQIQKEIASKLRIVDNKIKLNNSISSDLESMAKTLYDYWFVQFDFPDENGNPYKSSGGKMVWNEELKREIPEGWEASTLEQEFDIMMGSSPKGDSLNENKEGIEFYQGSTDFGDLFPVERVYTTAPVRFAKALDVLMSVRAPVGDMNFAFHDCCIGRGLAAIHHKSALYAYNTLRTFSAYFDLFNGSGTTFGALTSDDLKQQVVLSPNPELVDLYCDTMRSIERKLVEVEEENRELTSLRDFLLPMLMNGQVKIKEAE